MNTTTIASRHAPDRVPFTARRALRLLERLQQGTLCVETPDGAVRTFGQGGEPHATVSAHDWEVFGQAMAKGDIGVAETYMDGRWHTNDLAAMLGLFLRNRNEIESLIHGSWAGRLLYRLRHLMRHNSRANSRRNIAEHYDLGNSFYALWLDPTWNYSSALFEGDVARSMEDAQDAKVRRALRLANVRPGDRLLEIGCGWGALAEMGATEFGAHVTGVTLSTEQLAFAQQRLSRCAPGRSDLRLQDYRDIADGPYDAICSIEMIEAVGREYWPAYFGQVSRLLKPGGHACIQAITIDDALFDRYVSGTDFIQQYVFPGGCLPSPSQFEQQAARAGLEVVDRFAFGQDYARTLRVWRQRFLAQRGAVHALGFDDRFVRLWEFYLAYCEAAFEQCSTDVYQFTLRKPS